MMIPADGDGVIISMVSTLLTRTEASSGTNGIYIGTRRLHHRAIYARTHSGKRRPHRWLVDVMEASEDEFVSRTVTT